MLHCALWLQAAAAADRRAVDQARAKEQTQVKHTELTSANALLKGQLACRQLQLLLGVL